VTFVQAVSDRIAVSGAVRGGFTTFQLDPFAGDTAMQIEGVGSAHPPQLLVARCSACAGCEGATVYAAQLPIIEILVLLSLGLGVRELWQRARRRTV
jgi:hypothetical protein